MEFNSLYTLSKEEIIETISNIWSGKETEYSSQYKILLEDCFSNQIKEKSSYPIVQSMQPYLVSEDENYDRYLGGLWREIQSNKKTKYKPYKHQVESWYKLLKENKSIVVTTGTGSGKTECFMLPLLSDLRDNFEEEAIQAIFLYPLNALMEDQRSRLNSYIPKLLKDQKVNSSIIKFAVYNGSMPELKEDISENYILYDKEVGSRTEMREIVPNILLTNPTMLEYMLLRASDQKMIESSKGKLRWIVIDETHTFTGAGAAELALLIRRVVDAFKTDISNIRFATSSATLGNDGENKLKEFISGITGQPLEKIEIITGKRSSDFQIKEKVEITLQNGNVVLYNENELNKIENHLIREDYISLDDLITEGRSIDEKLYILDKLCDLGLKAKVHYFFRVLSDGLKINLSNFEDEGHFKLQAGEVSNNNLPLLDAYKCQSCQSVVAIGCLDESRNIKKLDRSEMNIFDLDLEDELIEEQNEDSNLSVNDDTNKRIYLFAPAKSSKISDKASYAKVGLDKKIDFDKSDSDSNLIYATDCNCPCCNNSIKRVCDEDEQMSLYKNYTSFRLSADFVSRIIAPVLLSEMEAYDNGIDTNLPMNGKQYISFVDSRQGASRSTMAQNLEVERRWIQHWMMSKLTDLLEHKKEIKIIEAEIQECACKGEFDRMGELSNKRKSLIANNLSFEFVSNELMKDSNLELLFNQFVDYKDDSRDQTKRKYILNLLLEQFGKRPRKAFSGETIGVVSIVYPSLDKIKEIPMSIKEFNEISNTKIDLADWKNLLRAYLDFNIRANGSLYFKRANEWNAIDINSIKQFRTKSNSRRSAVAPKWNDKGRQNRYTVYLCELAGWSIEDIKKNKEQNKIDLLNGIQDDFIKELLKVEVLSQSELYNERSWRVEVDNAIRMNLDQISFAPIEDPFFCPVTNTILSYDLKGYSPYLAEDMKLVPIEKIERWNNFRREDINTKENLLEWIRINRPVLIEKKLWNNLHSKVYLGIPVYVQAEHTAQVDKTLARQRQEQFKNHEINILACSTTMEMGVDLGDLQLVVMNSLPPHPANYKQRAGRSGRNNQNKSASLAIIASDSVGIRTCRNPKEMLINRVVSVPSVDLSSRQLVQRHVNAYLFKNHIKTISLRNDSIIDYFTNYHFRIDDLRAHSKLDKSAVLDQSERVVTPDAGIGDKENTMYEKFVNWLRYILQNQNIDKNTEILNGLRSLVRNSCLSNISNEELVDNTINDMTKLYEELSCKYLSIQIAYTNSTKDKYKRKLKLRYLSLMDSNLLVYLSTHQFIPNANMPVNIIEFIYEGNQGNRLVSKSASYELQQAISQYAPGNLVVLNNTSYIVRGIQYTNQYINLNAFKNIRQCLKCGKTYIDDIDVCSCLNKSEKVWSINNTTSLIMIEPTAFLKDENEEYGRIMDKNNYNKVEAQLIGAKKWEQSCITGLIQLRSGDSTSTSQILYYNVGQGQGYCVCTKCGRTAVEYAQSNNEPLMNLPREFMNDQTSHLDIKNKGHLCNNNGEVIKRNVILGGLIQTDFCELKLYKKNSDGSISIYNSEEVRHTLGIAICMIFSEMQGIERCDLSYIVMASGTLCIFDTAKGGAGYSSQLKDRYIFSEVLDKVYIELQNAVYKEDLLDKSTQKYIDKIDIDTTLRWLKEEKQFRGNIV